MSGRPSPEICLLTTVFLEKIHARLAYKRALETGKPYAYV